MKNQFLNNKGLTLIEMVVTIALIGVITASVFVMVDFSNRAFKASGERHDIQSNVRIGLDFITNKVRNAKDLKLITIANSNTEMGTHTNYNYIVIENKSIKHYQYNAAGGYIQTKISAKLVDNDTTKSSFDKSSTSNNSLVIKLTAESTDGKQSSTATTQVKLINFSMVSPATTIAGTGPKLAIAYK